jgi:ubiquitin thioesterase OTU1
MAKLQLRVKHKGGQSIVSSLNTDSRVQELQEELSRLTQIPVNQIKVLRGFPPSAIDLSNPSQTLLSECGIQERDTILVEELKAAEMIPQTKGVPQTDELLSAQSSMDTSGILLRKVVPSDNSCLFTSIGFCLSGIYFKILYHAMFCNYVFNIKIINFISFSIGKCDKNSSSLMRELVAATVKSQPEMYSEALLGKPNKDYCKWIQQDDSWGGAIEIAILSSYYGLEIDVVDTQNAIINKFGEDQNYGQRILLIYDGIHYDPLYLEPFSVIFAESNYETSV